MPSTAGLVTTRTLDRYIRPGHHRHQARLRHKMRVIKRRVDLRQLMQQSHLRGVLSSPTTVASATPIGPRPEGTFRVDAPERTPIYAVNRGLVSI
jgi:hypothetical protein